MRACVSALNLGWCSRHWLHPTEDSGSPESAMDIRSSERFCRVQGRQAGSGEWRRSAGLHNLSQTLIMQIPLLLVFRVTLLESFKPHFIPSETAIDIFFLTSCSVGYHRLAEVNAILRTVLFLSLFLILLPTPNFFLVNLFAHSNDFFA